MGEIKVNLGRKNSSLLTDAARTGHRCVLVIDWLNWCDRLKLSSVIIAARTWSVAPSQSVVGRKFAPLHHRILTFHSICRVWLGRRWLGQVTMCLVSDVTSDWQRGFINPWTIYPFSLSLSLLPDELSIQGLLKQRNGEKKITRMKSCLLNFLQLHCILLGALVRSTCVSVSVNLCV